MKEEEFKKSIEYILNNLKLNYNKKYFKLFNENNKKNKYIDLNLSDQHILNKVFEDIILFDRINFTQLIKKEILSISGGFCTICGKLTIYPQLDRKSSVCIGEACHIKPASRFGPRNQENITLNSEYFNEIGSIENGLWACKNCHKEIDSDFNRYTIEYLKELKINHEKNILELKNHNHDIKIILDHIRNLNIKNNEYTYVKKDIFEDTLLINNNLNKNLDKKNKEIEEIYLQLSNIEKKSVDNLSAFKLLNESNNRLYDQFGNYKLDMSPNHLNLIFKQENIKDVDSAFEEFKKTNNFDKYYSTTIQKEVKEDMVNELSDHNKDFEFFIINKENTNIIKFKFLELKFKFNDKEEKITLIKKNFIININKKDNLTNIEMYTPINHNLQYYLINEFCFINQIENFDISDFFLMIRYKKNIYKVHLVNLTPINY